MKSKPAIYFPTTVMLVDDDNDFLVSLLLHLSPEKAAYQQWTNPRECLIRLNAEFRPDPFEMNWVARGEDQYFEHRIMDVNIPDLHKEVYAQDRFEQISTIVVDYQMPGINGLEFCTSIKNQHVRKILLTGQTDERIAIEAFNKGLIHQYIRKQDPQLPQVLNEAIHQAQHDYFCALTRDINRVVMLPPEDTALSDSIYIDFLENHAQNFGAVEHYLCEATGSFLFVNAQGETSGVYVAFESVLNSISENASNHDVPLHIIDQLRRREKMLCYHSRNGHDLPHGSKWEQHLFPVIKLEGRKTYYCAIAPNIFDIDRSRIKPFSAFKKIVKPKVSSDHLEESLTSRQSALHNLSC